MLTTRASPLKILSVIFLIFSTYSYNRFKHINLSDLYTTNPWKSLILRATVNGEVFISNTVRSGIFDTIADNEVLGPIPSVNPSIPGGGTVWPILAMINDHTPKAIVYHDAENVYSLLYLDAKQSTKLDNSKWWYFSIKYDDNYVIVAHMDSYRGNSSNSNYWSYVTIIQISPLTIWKTRSYSKKVCMANGIWNMENGTKKQIVVMCFDSSNKTISYTYINFLDLLDINVEAKLIDFAEEANTVIQLTEINNEQFIMCFPYSQSTKLSCFSGIYTKVSMTVVNQNKDLLVNLTPGQSETFSMCKYTSSRVMLGYGNITKFKIALINFKLSVEGTLDIFGADNYKYFDWVVLKNSSLWIVGQSGQYSGKWYGYWYQPMFCPDNQTYTIPLLDCFDLTAIMPTSSNIITSDISLKFTTNANKFTVNDNVIETEKLYSLSQWTCLQAEASSSLEFDIFNKKWFGLDIAENSCLISFIKEEKCFVSCNTCDEKGTDQNHLCITCDDGYYEVEDIEKNCYTNLDGYYWDDDILRKCYFTCATCSGEWITDQVPNLHNCITCNINYPYYLNNTNCVDTWEENFYYDTNEEHYRQCAVQCATCEEVEDNCWTCNNDDLYYAIEDTNKCVTKESITEDYYFDEVANMFKKCYPTCRTCKVNGTHETHQCETCIDNYESSKEIVSNCINVIYECKDILRAISSKEILTWNLNEINQIFKVSDSNVGSDLTVYSIQKPAIHSINGVLNFVDIDNQVIGSLIFEEGTLHDIISYSSTPETVSVFSYYKTNSEGDVISHQGTITIIVCPNNCQRCTSVNECAKCEDDKYTLFDDPLIPGRFSCVDKCPFRYDEFTCVDECPLGKKENSEGKCILDFLNEEPDGSYSSEKDSKDTIDSLDDYINDYIDIGPIITGEDFTLEIFNPSDKEYQDNPYTSGINFAECEKILLKHYNLNEIVIVKIDIYEEGNFMPIVEYRVYDKYGNKLDLIFCEDITVTISKPITDPDAIDHEKALEYWEKGINIYDRNNAIFINPCLHFHINYKDWIWSDRIKFLYKEVTFCEDWCENKTWDLINLKVECDCKVKEMETKIESKGRETDIYTIRNNNFQVWKCYKEVFELKMFTYNIGFYFVSAWVWFELFVALVYFQKTLKHLMSRIHEKYKDYTVSYKLEMSANPPRNNGKNIISGSSSCNTEKKEIKYNYDYFQRTLENKDDEGERKKDKTLQIEVIESLENEIEKGIINPPCYHDNDNNNNNNEHDINTDRQFGKHNHNFFTDEDIDTQKESKVKSNNKTQNIRSVAAQGENAKNKRTKNSKNSSTFSKRKQKTNCSSNKILNNSLKFEDNFEKKINRNWVIYPKTSAMENLPYEKAIAKDTRGLCSILCTLIREKFLILRVFYPISEFEIKSLPFSILILKTGLSGTLTWILYTERFISNKFWGFSITIIEHFYMATISWIVTYVWCRTFSFSKQYYTVWERICYEEKKTKDFTWLLAVAFDKIKQRMIFILFFEIMLLGFMWYYIICFCGVYQLTQWNWMISSLFSVGLDTVITLFVISLLSWMKYCALRCRSKRWFYFYGIGKRIL